MSQALRHLLLALLVLTAPWSMAAADEPVEAAWQSTLERVAPAVVSIHVTAVRDFDTEDASTSQGTGFVVDAERGLILTNRHMVHAGPVTARATFLDNEEADLEPIYRDPVHDFGVYRFDPADIEYMDLAELELAPDAARVGLDIRVVGNDAGEKLAILDGTLARLDRNAPFYGRNTYNDFNTFYYQAASNTSGGSSGSPVIDVRGRVVALNAGGATQAASSFYLPLHRVVPALDRLRRGEAIARGTVQTTFQHRSYEDLTRLGLVQATEAAARAHRPEDAGLLVVDRVVPEGPADGALRVGDIVVRAGSRWFPTFVDLAELMDDGVGTSLEIEVERLGTRQAVKLTVQDLHAITPASFLEIGRGILHDVSYHQARNHDVPQHGVYVATGGFMFEDVPEGSLVTHIDGEAVPDLDALQAILETKPDRARIRVRHVPISEIQAARQVVQTVDRTWFTARRCIREDDRGTWPCTPLADPPARQPTPPATLALPDRGKGLARKLGPALVVVEFTVPYSTAGVSGQGFVGAGVVIDASRGLVLVDRDTVPVALGDLTLTFAGTVRVPGDVVWLHPEHNAAVLSYDPAAVAGIEVAEVSLGPKPAKAGAKVHVVGRDRDGVVVVDKVVVEELESLYARPSETPRFRDVNVEVLDLERVESTVGGVITDGKGRMLGLWASYYFPGRRDRYFYGLPTDYLRGPIEALREGRTPVHRTTGVEWRPIPLADARERGLSDARVSAYIRHDPEHLEVLEAVRVSGEGPAAERVQRTDLLILANGEPVSRLKDVATWSEQDQVSLTLLRDGEEVQVALPLQAQSGQGVRRIVSWAGLILHDPHPEVAAQQGVQADGAYVAWYWYGSPAARDGIRPTRRVTAIDGEPIADLDAFLEAVQARGANGPMVLTLEDLDGIEDVRAIEPDPAYWPLEVVTWADGRWTRFQP